jgi:hypothetical protein
MGPLLTSGFDRQRQFPISALNALTTAPSSRCQLGRRSNFGRPTIWLGTGRLERLRSPWDGGFAGRSGYRPIAWRGQALLACELFRIARTVKWTLIATTSSSDHVTIALVGRLVKGDLDLLRDAAGRPECRS